MSLRLHPDVVTTDTADGTVLLHQRSGRYWQLNTTGARVLRALVEGHTPQQVAADLATSHGIDRHRAERDVTAVVGQLRDAELVVS